MSALAPGREGRPGRDGRPGPAEPPEAGQDPSLGYLFGRLAIVEERVRAAVERRRADDPDPNDRFRGLYISDAQVDGLLGATGTPLVPDGASEAAAVALEQLETRADAPHGRGDPSGRPRSQRFPAVSRALRPSPLRPRACASRSPRRPRSDGS